MLPFAFAGFNDAAAPPPPKALLLRTPNLPTASLTEMAHDIAEYTSAENALCAAPENANMCKHVRRMETVGMPNALLLRIIHSLLLRMKNMCKTVRHMDLAGENAGCISA